MTLEGSPKVLPRFLCWNRRRHTCRLLPVQPALSPVSSSCLLLPPPCPPPPPLQESEKLETVNTDLKAQIEELKRQKQQLVYMLNLHRPTCIVRAQNGQTPEDERNLFLQHIKESSLQLHGLSSSSPSSPSQAPLPAGFLMLEHLHCPDHL